MASFLLWGSAVALVASILYSFCDFSERERDAKSPVGSGKMFDAIAPQYDITNTLLSLGMHVGWRERMINALELKPGKFKHLKANR
jgi:hypothetical protein